jgi:hypothetical protein
VLADNAGKQSGKLTIGRPGNSFRGDQNFQVVTTFLKGRDVPCRKDEQAIV